MFINSMGGGGVNNPQQALQASQLMQQIMAQMQAQTIGVQTDAGIANQQLDQQKIKADFTTKVTNTVQDVTQNSQKGADKSAQGEDQLMRS